MTDQRGSPPTNGEGPPPQEANPQAATNDPARSAPERITPGRLSVPDTVPTPYAAPKRPAAEFWDLYARLTAGEFGGEPDDPGNAWEHGALELDGLLPGDRVPDRFALPPDVAEAFQRAADAYARFVDAVDDFEALNPRWARQQALRRALPGVSGPPLRRLMVLLADVPTDTLAAACATAQNGVPA